MGRAVLIARGISFISSSSDEVAALLFVVLALRK